MTTGARIRGLTPNATQLALARNLAVEEAVGDRVAFDHGHAGALPYPDNEFDAGAAAAGAFTLGRFLAVKDGARDIT